jgi:hypothetical protein
MSEQSTTQSNTTATSSAAQFKYKVVYATGGLESQVTKMTEAEASTLQARGGVTVTRVD